MGPTESEPKDGQRCSHVVQPGAVAVFFNRWLLENKLGMPVRCEAEYRQWSNGKVEIAVLVLADEEQADTTIGGDSG